jgi:twinkle protein
MESNLQELAKRYSGIVRDIDLTDYRSEEVAHRVKSVSEYAEAVGKLIFTPDLDQGAALPFMKMKGNFHIRQNEMTIWAGYKAHGKSAFTSQVLNALMVRGESVFVISPEFKPERVIERMIYQRIGGRDLDDEGLFDWFSWAQGRLWLYDVQSSLRPDDVLALCRYAIDKYKVKHIFIDSLMKCGIDPDDYSKQKNFPCHMHLVAHARKGSSDESIPKLHDIKGASEIADMAENVVVVWRNKAKEKCVSINDTSKDQEPDAIVIVEAQRNAHGWVGAMHLTYEPNSMLFYEAGQRAYTSAATSGDLNCPI